MVSFALVAAACGDKSDTVDNGGTSAPSGSDAAETTAPPETLAPAAEVVEGGKIVFAGEAETGNPWQPQQMTCDSFCQMRARTFYDSIVTIDDDLNWRPFLAESIEPNEDSTVFTFKVREGIEFHDGTPLNADAMIRALNEGINSILVGKALKDVARVDGVVVTEKLDDMTFTVALGKDGDPNAPLSWPLFPYYLGGQAGLVASPTWLDAVKDGTADPSEPVGTGPFTMEKYTPGDIMIVKKNPNYWLKDGEGRQLPYLDEIEFRVITDSQVRATALKAGDVDMLATSDAAVVGDLRDNSKFVTLVKNSLGETNYVMLNLTKPFLQDKRVRCALNQALDKEDIINVIGNGVGEPANGPFAPGIEGHLEDNGSLPYDPDAAAAAIEEYEAENGPLTINYSTTTAATTLATAQYFQNIWGQIGIDVTINQIEQSVLINNALFGDPGFDAFGWRNHGGIFFDQQYFWWHSSSAAPPPGLALNFGRLNDPEIDRLLDESRSETDPDARRELAEEANRRFASECFIVPTSYTTWGISMTPSIQGIGRTPQPDGDGFLRDSAGFAGQVWLTAAFVSK
jgi:peptide/nickel transport system substrate-binding protein